MFVHELKFDMDVGYDTVPLPDKAQLLLLPPLPIFTQNNVSEYKPVVKSPLILTSS